MTFGRSITVSRLLKLRIEDGSKDRERTEAMAFWNKDEKHSAVTEDQILSALKQVQDPDLRKDIVALGFIRNLKIDSGKVSFDLNLTTPACPVKDQMRDQARAAVRRIRERAEKLKLGSFEWAEWKSYRDRGRS